MSPINTPAELVEHLHQLLDSGEFNSRAALARAVGAAPSQMSVWLNGKVKPQQATVTNILKRLAGPGDTDGEDEDEGREADKATEVPEDEAQRLVEIARLVMAGPSTDSGSPSISQKADLHPVLHNLFPGKSTPADLRHRAWGAVVWELARLAGGDASLEALGDRSAVLRGLRGDGAPYRLGWASLQFKTVTRADGSARRIAGALTHTVALLPEPVRKHALLLLAGLCEPQFIVNLAVGSDHPDQDGPRTVALLRGDGRESAATNLDQALFGDAPSNGSRARLHRALALYVFVAAKSLYDGLLLRADADPETALFARIRKHLGQTVPSLAYASPTPIRSADPGAIALWEQYTHIHVEKADGQQGPAHVGMGPVAHPGGGGTDAVRVPSLGDQRRRLGQHLDAWRTTGLVDADAFIDTEVRYTRCELPDVRARWEAARLDEVAERFAAEVSEDATHSHLVCLVGPYGTGKTTIAQRLFAELHAADRDQWQILAWDPAKRLLEPRPLYGRDAIRTFKQHDLSRVLVELGSEVTLHLSSAVAPGVRLIVNASEMNAVGLSGGGAAGAQGAGGGAGLEAIEALLREVTEKYLPTDVVAFVAMQAASLIGELGSFFSARPDMVMGRARLDSLWLVRGDCLQVRLAAGGEEDLVLRLIDERLPGCPTLNRILARRMSVPLGLKLEHLSGQLGAEHIAGASGGALSALHSFVRRAGALSGGRAAADGGGEVAPIDEYVPESGGLSLAMRQSVGTLVSTQAALWNGFQRQFLEMIRNEAELLQRTLGDLPLEGSRTGYAEVENLARALWLESLAVVASSQLGLKSSGGVSLGAELPVTPLGTRVEKLRNPGGRPVRVTPWHMALGSTDDLDTAWYVVAKAGKKAEPVRWLLGVDIARKAPRSGAEHLGKKARVGDLLHIDPASRAPVTLLLKDGGVPRLSHSGRGLRVADVPQFLSALVLRIADRCTAGKEGLSRWVESGDEERSPCVADVWIDDDDSPDPRDWRVSRVLIALRPDDYGMLADKVEDVGEWVKDILAKLEATADRASGAPRSVLPVREVRRLVWEFERGHLDTAGDAWTPEELLEPGDNQASAPPVADLTVDGSGFISTTRNLPLQRVYVREDENTQKLALAIVAWEAPATAADASAEGWSFRPRKPIELAGADGGFTLSKRSGKDRGPSTVLYQCTRPEEATLALFGPVSRDGDTEAAPKLVWFGPYQPGAQTPPRGANE